MTDAEVRLSKQSASLQRRDFMRRTALLAMTPLILSACAGAGPISTEPDRARQRSQIETDFYTTLEHCYAIVPGSRDLVAKSVGVLVFPTVAATNAMNGEQSGMGALREGNVFSGYFLLTSASGGHERNPGEVRSVVFLFTTFDALNQFRNSNPWSGIDTKMMPPAVYPDARIDKSSPLAPLLVLVLAGGKLLGKQALTAFSVVPLNI